MTRWSRSDRISGVRLPGWPPIGSAEGRPPLPTSIMGAGAASATLSDLPAQVDERTAKACAGDQFDEAAFTSAANDAGLVSKEDFLKAAAAAGDAVTLVCYFRVHGNYH